MNSNHGKPSGDMNPGNGMTVYRRMLQYVRPYSARLAASLVFMVATSSLGGAIAFLVKPALDDIFIKKDPTQLSILPIIIVLVYLSKGLSEFANIYLMSQVGQRVVRDIREHLYRHMQSLSLAFYMRNPTGTLMSRVINDVGSMQGAITNAVTGIVKDFFSAIFLAGVVFYRDWQLGLVATVGFPLAFWPIAAFGKKLRHTSRKTQELAGGITTHLQETISGVKLVKSFGTEDYETGRFVTRNAELYRLSMKSVKMQALTAPLSEVFAGFGAAAVIFYGGYSVIEGRSTPGNFFSFMTALFMMYEPVKRLSRVNNTVQQGIAAAERVFEVIDTIPEVQEKAGAATLEGVRREIEFRDVGFRYAADGPTILSAVSLRVPIGTMVAIIGSSGAGKTTLVDLIPRFYDPTEGSILVDGVDLRDMTVASLRANIAVVSQHTVLFNDTVRNNIAYGTTGATDEQIVEAAKKANAHAFISAFPDGYLSTVGEQGMKLSGGERQRLAIARAILRNAPILVLDEATSALDNESERVVQEALDTLMAGRTTFVIAHRLSTVRNADTIVVVEKGRVIERGRHDELLAIPSRYRDFYLKQFEERKPAAEPARTDA